MRNRDSLLGRARPADRLTREQIAALDKANLNSRRSPSAHKAHEAHSAAAGNTSTQPNSG